MNQYLRDRISIAESTETGSYTHLGSVEVSTADTNKRLYVPETCLFWGNGSKVVERYNTWDEAVEGHQSWMNNPQRVFEAIVAARAEREKED